jgi:predicted DNA-binding protein (MmcQ/YjbR family)
MDLSQVQLYLSQKPESQLSYPFDPAVPVYKIMNKVFALLAPSGGNITEFPLLNLKCDPDHAQELRDVFDAVIPGYHMNKKHWNSLILDGSLPESEIKRLIDHSYALVASKLTRSQKTPLELKYPKATLYQSLKPYE